MGDCQQDYAHSRKMNVASVFYCHGNEAAWYMITWKFRKSTTPAYLVDSVEEPVPASGLGIVHRRYGKGRDAI